MANSGIYCQRCSTECAKDYHSRAQSSDVVIFDWLCPRCNWRIGGGVVPVLHVSNQLQQEYHAALSVLHDDYLKKLTAARDHYLARVKAILSENPKESDSE